MEGIWYAHFTARLAQWDGVTVLRDAKVLGADLRHPYSGSYREDRNVLYANIRVTSDAPPHVLPNIEHLFSLFLEDRLPNGQLRPPAQPSERDREHRIAQGGVNVRFGAEGHASHDGIFGSCQLTLI